MLSAKRSLLASLALILLFVLLAVEARRYVGADESGAGELRHHRHRHRHEAPGQRWPSTGSRRRANNDDEDYDDNYQSDVDYEEYTYDEDSEEEDYGAERRNSRLYPLKRNNNNHHRYEPRYPTSRYHHRPTHYAGTGRGYEPRGHDRLAHHRSNTRTSYRKRHKDEDEYSDEDTDSYNDRSANRRRYDNDDGNDDIVDSEPTGYFYNKYKGSSRKRLMPYSSDSGESKSRRSRYEPRKDWRYKLDDDDDEYAYYADDEDEEEQDDIRSRKHATRKSRIYQDESKSASDREEPMSGRRSSSSKFNEWLKRTRLPLSNSSRGYDSSRKRYSHPMVHDEDDRDEEAALDDEDEEVELWKDEDEDKELDNDFYKNDEAASSSLKTFDDIIRRLTEDRMSTSTAKSTTQVKRNTDIESHLRRDAYGNLRFFESKRNGSFSSQSRYRSSVAPISRSLNLVDGTTKGQKDLTAAATSNFDGARRKSLERYEEEDNAKRGGEDLAGIQADANTDYVDDENKEEETNSSTTSTTAAPRSTTTPTTTTSTTKKTTTTQRAISSGSRYDRKEPRSYNPVSTGNQYNGYQSKSDYPPMSAHSALKWQTLGTREGVKKTRNNMSQFGRSGSAAMITEAHNHAMQVAKEGSCEWPRERVIPVRDVHPNSMATYVPHCAILHRCTDDTGCCESETFTCQAKHIQRVELYFYVTYIHGKTEIEKLSFDNHTECECRERKNFGSMNDRVMEFRNAKQFYPAPQNFVRSSTSKPCYCSSQFASKITIDGVCECTCMEGDEKCSRFQSGKGFLSATDRSCIKAGNCTPPKCKFGDYIVSKGKCPQKRDMYNIIGEAVKSRRRERVKK